MLALIQEEFPADVRVVYRHFPLVSIHDKAALSAQAADAAGQQGKFWEMHDLLFALQAEWKDKTPVEFQGWLEEQAQAMGLDTDKFRADMLSTEMTARAQAAWDRGVEIGMPGTPFLLIDGDIFPSSLPMSQGNIAAIIRLKLLEKRQFTECPPISVDPSIQYVATLRTEKGDIVIELFADKAPLAVNNFIFLARKGWYDGVTFHRVVKDFVAQAGDPSGTGYGTPGYAFSNEILPELTFDREGLVAMANAGQDSNGSQFFITLAPAPHLDGGYTIFGEVVSGMEIAKSLTLRDPAQGLDLPAGDQIILIEIEEK